MYYINDWMSLLCLQFEELSHQIYYTWLTGAGCFSSQSLNMSFLCLLTSIICNEKSAMNDTLFPFIKWVLIFSALKFFFAFQQFGGDVSKCTSCLCLLFRSMDLLVLDKSSLLEQTLVHLWWATFFHYASCLGLVFGLPSPVSAQILLH